MSTVPGEEDDTSGTDAVADGPAPAASDTPAAPRPGRKSTRERAEEKRQAKLDLVREQVEDGSLVIRQMTDEERQRYAPPARPTRVARGR